MSVKTAQNLSHMVAGFLGRIGDRRRRMKSMVRGKLKKSAFALMTDCRGKIGEQYLLRNYNRLIYFLALFTVSGGGIMMEWTPAPDGTYRESGWTRVGTTQGRGRYDRHTKRAQPNKDIWLRPLRKDWQRTLNW